MNGVGKKKREKLDMLCSGNSSLSDYSDSEDLCSNTSANVPNLMTSASASGNGVDTTSTSSITEDIEAEEVASSGSGELFTLTTTKTTPLEYQDETSSDRTESSTNERIQIEAQVDEDDSLSDKLNSGVINEGQQKSRLTSDKSTNETEALIKQESDKLSSKATSAAVISKSPSSTNKIKFETVLSDQIPADPPIAKSPKVQGKEQKQYDFSDDPTMPGVEAIHCPKGIMHDLAEPMFDVWRLDRDSMVDHIEYMYHDLGVVRAWKIPRTTLRMFLLGVRERYQDNPYHNFKHCFCVTQMAYSMLCKLRLNRLISIDHMGSLLTAAVCHDVDHPGLNNSYHSHARTPLAILYNYKSILEQHHFAVTCRILSNKERNIFRNVNNRDEVLTNVGELILSTDLARHKGIMEDYSNFLDVGFDFKNSEHVMSLLKMIIKCADVSNEVRPETVAGPWVERLFAEYYQQSAREKRECLPITSYMDPDMVNVSESQEGFIRGMMLPMYDELSKLMVEARVYYVNPLCESLVRYEVQNLRAREVKDHF